MVTTAKRKNSARAGKGAAARPVAPEALRRARTIADSYQIVVRLEDGQYAGRGLEYPECVGFGATAAAAVEETRAAMVAGVAVMLERGQTPPPPASEGARTEQVNIRFSAEEKLALETAARQRGFRGISDYIRAVTLEPARGGGKA
jgi:hypothetical protein